MLSQHTREYSRQEVRNIIEQNKNDALMVDHKKIRRAAKTQYESKSGNDFEHPSTPYFLLSSMTSLYTLKMSL